MSFWALLRRLPCPFCGEGRAEHVWKGQVWSWRCGCLKGEKTKEWKNEELIFNAQNSFSILLKSQFLSSTLVVLSSKRLTFQAQTFGVLSSKRLTFQVQTLDVLSSKRLTFQAQCLVFYLLKVQLSKLNAWCFIFQKSNFSSSMLGVLSSKSPTFQAQYLVFYLPKVQLSKLNAWCFIFQKTNIPSSMLGVLSSERLTSKV